MARARSPTSPRGAPGDAAEAHLSRARFAIVARRHTRLQYYVYRVPRRQGWVLRTVSRVGGTPWLAYGVLYSNHILEAHACFLVSLCLLFASVGQASARPITSLP